jgi:hypothetical protein
MRLSLTSIALSSAALACAVAGCTSRSQVFEGYSQDQVWSAMIAAAQSPEYDDWKIAENETFVDEDGRRVEVYRVLRRLLVTPYADPRKESEEWRLQLVLAHDMDIDAPVVDFTARQITVPAHVWREADRYFGQVRTLLGPPEATKANKATNATNATNAAEVPDAGEKAAEPTAMPADSAIPSGGESAPATAPQEQPQEQPQEPLPESHHM